MADSKVHALVGAGTSVVGWLLFCRFTGREVKLGEVCLAAGVGAVLGLAPDLLEPAKHPNHRHFFHSLAAAMTIAECNRRARNNPHLSKEHRALLGLCCAAYFSHLALDGGTPKGVPLISLDRFGGLQ